MFRLRVSRLVAGAGARTLTGMELKKLNISRCCLITGPKTGSTGYCREVVKSVEAEGIEVSVWKGVDREPDEEIFSDCLDFVRNEEPDAVVAFGGGSVLDTAKIVNACYCLGRDLRFFLTPSSQLARFRLKPFIAIPTTFGTGSETTCASVLKVDGVKRGILHESLLPDTAILDWEIKAPERVAASAGMDAVMHAFEAYTCLESDRVESGFYSGSNEVTDSLALRALELLSNLPDYVKRGEHAREVAVGSNVAGMAFGNAGVHFGHAASYAIAALTGKPHGECVASVGQALLEWIEENISRERAEDVRKALGRNIDDVRREAGTPSLSEMGLGIDDVPELVKRTMEVKRLIAMRPEIDEKAAREIFERALSF